MKSMRVPFERFSKWGTYPGNLGVAVEVTRGHGVLLLLLALSW